MSQSQKPAKIKVEKKRKKTDKHRADEKKKKTIKK